MELRVRQDSFQLCGRLMRDEGNAVSCLPMVYEPAQPSIGKEERGEDGIGVEDDSRFGGDIHSL